MGETRLYDLLGVKRDSDLSELKKAYKLLVLKTHPDKGGNEEEFKIVNEAWKVLSDEKQRRAYDRKILTRRSTDGIDSSTFDRSHIRRNTIGKFNNRDFNNQTSHDGARNDPLCSTNSVIGGNGGLNGEKSYSSSYWHSAARRNTDFESDSNTAHKDNVYNNWKHKNSQNYTEVPSSQVNHDKKTEQFDTPMSSPANKFQERYRRCKTTPIPTSENEPTSLEVPPPPSVLVTLSLKKLNDYIILFKLDKSKCIEKDELVAILVKEYERRLEYNAKHFPKGESDVRKNSSNAKFPNEAENLTKATDKPQREGKPPGQRSPNSNVDPKKNHADQHKDDFNRHFQNCGDNSPSRKFGPKDRRVEPGRSNGRDSEEKGVDASNKWRANPSNQTKIPTYTDEEMSKMLSIKIITLGNKGVGKTSLINRFSSFTFSPTYNPTIGIEYSVKILSNSDLISPQKEGKHGNQKHDNFDTKNKEKHTKTKLNIFDLSGDPVYRNVRLNFYKYVQSIFLIFDLTNKQSFLDIDLWLAEALQNLKKKPTPGKQLPMMVLVGTKKDMSKQRQVSFDTASTYAFRKKLRLEMRREKLEMV